jgi:hypothetical protein
MDHTYSVHYLCFLRSILNWSVLTFAGLVCACNPGQSADMERVQADNIRLTKALHAHVNHHDWQAVEGLCAGTIRYRGRATHVADVEKSKVQFLNYYRTVLNAGKQGSVVIKELYPAGSYHVIVEGMVEGQPPDTTLPV